MARVVQASRIPMPAEALFAFRQDARNIARISPPFPRIDMEAPARPAEPGDMQHLHIHTPFRIIRMTIVIRDVIPPRAVIDEQMEGPFRRWRHRHMVIPKGETESKLIDDLDFTLLPGQVGAWLDRLVVAPLIQLQFARQHRRLRMLLSRRRGVRRVLHVPHVPGHG